MVEENAVREDLTFAEMAQLVIAARDDRRTGFTSYDEALTRLYGSLHRMKRSNIKQFVTLMATLGDALKWPKAIGRDLGANLGRRLREDRDLARRLRPALLATETPEAQNAALRAALAPERPAAPRPAARRVSAGGLTASLSERECRIRLPADLAALPDERLAAALAAFRAALDG
jgi:ParB family chromosome partitioning protein